MVTRIAILLLLLGSSRLDAQVTLRPATADEVREGKLKQIAYVTPWGFGQNAVPALNLRANTAAGFDANTNLTSVSLLTLTAPAVPGMLAVTADTNAVVVNYGIWATNYVAADFAPLSGKVKFPVPSNDWFYAVTEYSTNAVYKFR